MNAYAEIAQIYGNVDPKDEAAVQHFFEATLPTFPPIKQQKIVDELFFKTTGLGPESADKQQQNRTALSETQNHKLTNLEQRILELIAKGRTNHEIAQQLTLSQRVIKSTIIDIWEKIDIAVKNTLTADPKKNVFLNPREPLPLMYRTTVAHYVRYLKTPPGSAESFQIWNELMAARTRHS